MAASSLVYLLTIEPTASFWDCGEFIASSYKLEVGHPPGNPVFQLFARFFSMFASPENAAMAVNAMSALCSAFTIFFLYLSIVHIARRIVRPAADGTYSVASAIAVFGAGAVGAMAYCFSDTFWFSAVEAEVYAMSSLFTAMVFWAMLKWYEQADTPYSSRHWYSFIYTGKGTGLPSGRVSSILSFRPYWWRSYCTVLCLCCLNWPPISICFS